MRSVGPKKQQTDTIGGSVSDFLTHVTGWACSHSPDGVFHMTPPEDISLPTSVSRDFVYLTTATHHDCLFDKDHFKMQTAGLLITPLEELKKLSDSVQLPATPR